MTPDCEEVYEPEPSRNGVMPSDRAAEEHVIACCLLDRGPSLARARQRLTPESFYYPENGLLFRHLSQLQDEGLPIDEASLLEYRGEHLRGLNPQHLLQLTDPTRYGTTVHVGRMIEQVADMQYRRAVMAYASDLAHAAKRGERLPEAPRPPQAQRSTRVRFTLPPPEPQTRLFLANKPICTPGNLTTIIARAKTGKTAALGAAVSAIIGAHHDRQGLDTFGFTAPHTSDSVLLIDTEQAPYDAWMCHERMLSRAGGVADPDWLHHHACVGFTAQQLRDKLKAELAQIRASGRSVFTVILDGVADFVASVNDEVESNAFVADLQSLAVEYDTPVICVIHSNEGVKNGDDGRGHLGKQLTRKAESNLLLKKEGEITTITSEKQRKAPITAQDGIAFRWDDEAQRHVSCEPMEPKPKRAGGAPKKYSFEQFAFLFKRPVKDALSRSQLHRFATDISDISMTAFREIINEGMSSHGVKRIDRNGSFYYYIDLPPA